jgi:FAD/FMN-containing dehydrogenase
MDTSKIVRDLKSRPINGEIIDAIHDDYDRARRVWNAMADRQPAVIVRASGVADVEQVVATAAEHGALLAVRGGGHSIPGLSTCDGGIVLDLSHMNAIEVDRSSLRATVLGGALLYNVPQNSDKKRRCSKVHHLVCVNNTPRLSKPSSFVRC